MDLAVVALQELFDDYIGWLSDSSNNLYWVKRVRQGDPILAPIQNYPFIYIERWPNITTVDRMTWYNKYNWWISVWFVQAMKNQLTHWDSENIVKIKQQVRKAIDGMKATGWPKDDTILWLLEANTCLTTGWNKVTVDMNNIAISFNTNTNRWLTTYEWVISFDVTVSWA